MVVKEQIHFYESLFKLFGDSPKSTGQNDQVTQYCRFARLAKLFENDQSLFSIHEIGCGLGHFYEFLKDNDIKCVYSGSDISRIFVELCRRKHPECTFLLRDISEQDCTDKYDYLLENGIFNPFLSAQKQEWKKFVESMICKMYEMCTRGIAVNFLTSYADYYDRKLYYCQPMSIYDFVHKHLSRFIVLDSSYPLYEFTVIIYREEYVTSQYTESEFCKYFKKKTSYVTVRNREAK